MTILAIKIILNFSEALLITGEPVYNPQFKKVVGI